MIQVLSCTKMAIRTSKKSLVKVPEDSPRPAILRVKETKELQPFLRVSNYKQWKDLPSYQYL
jgi:hypothetical protein